jgi:phytoene dehydrogenase-like protein
MVRTEEYVSVLSPEGKFFHDYYDLERLDQHLSEISPVDSRVIKQYIDSIRWCTKQDLFGEAMFGTTWGLIKMAPAMISSLRRFKPTMQKFAERFSDPFLKRAFPLLVYSIPSLPFFLHVAMLAYGYKESIQWPVGGAQEFAKSIEKRYRELGGEVHYRHKVEKILVEDDRAVGVRLADGTEHRADIVISNADGRKTIMNMLEGKYANERIRGYCAEPPDETDFAVHVFLGVNRDLSHEPSALIMLLDKPVTIANHENKSLEMQIYGFDKTMAPEGKGVIKVELVSTYSYWKELYADRKKYDEEKQKVAEQVIDVLEQHFKGIKSQIEVIDVPTLMTWERFMGGTHGFANFPTKKISILGSILGKGQETMLPGLGDFHLVGSWVTSAGALPANALSGRKVIKEICQRDGKIFTSTAM